jgi:hypothetical protein
MIILTKREEPGIRENTADILIHMSITVNL